MAFDTVVAGTAITATWGNTVRDQYIAPFASTGARSSAITSPVNGQVSAITAADATHGIYQYNGTAWRIPWNLPWGEVSSSRQTSTSLATSTTTATDLLSVTLTIPARRRIKLCANITVSGTVAGDECRVYVVVDSTTVQIDQQSTTAGKAETYQPVGTYVTDGSSHTYKVGLARQSGSGTLAVVSSANFPSEFWLEDLGPTGAPA